MAVDHFRYDLLAQEALLRGVVRRVLADAAKNGLPGDHHFFVTFDTRAPGAKISPRLQAQHPEELTIVLQHQFWDLSVNDDGFEVGLSFGGIPERVVVPFAAVTGFFDPSVEFGLRFEIVPAGQDNTGVVASPPDAVRAAEPADTGESKEPPDEPGPPYPPSQGGEVVRLDRFRKK